MSALVRISLAVGCCSCSSVDTASPLLAYGGEVQTLRGDLQPPSLGAGLVSSALLPVVWPPRHARPRSARTSREERSPLKPGPQRTGLTTTESTRSALRTTARDSSAIADRSRR